MVRVRRLGGRVRRGDGARHGAADKFGLIVTPALAGFALVGALVTEPPAAQRDRLAAAGGRDPVLGRARWSRRWPSQMKHPTALVMWLDDWIGDVWIAIVGVWIPLLFPDGRLLSRRWRVVAWFGTVAFAVGVLASAFGDARAATPRRPGHHPQPVRLPGAAGDALGALVAPARAPMRRRVHRRRWPALVVRLRRARGVERLQLKWFAYVASLMLGFAAGRRAEPRLPRSGRRRGGRRSAGALFLLLVVFGLPAAMGASILRHRLYDIDVVINRTLVYGALTATPGGDVPRARAAGRADGRPVERRGRGLDARGRGAVPPGARADPGDGRPALLPPPLRRGADARGVRRAAARRARPRGAARRDLRGVVGRRCSPRTCRCG